MKILRQMKQHEIKRVNNELDNPQKTYVYFIEARDDLHEPMVKIGVSTNLEKRVNQLTQEIEAGKYQIDWLQYGGASLRLLGYVDGAFDLEKSLHSCFKDWSLGREWFILDLVLDMAIDDILDNYCVCKLCLAMDGATNAI
jgi:anti-sigma28 factor (negative regulator of flagellin synthesis)